MPRVMNEADFAITSFGMTAYELACMGTPSIYLCLTEDHAESAEAFVKSGIGRSLGCYTNVDMESISIQIKQFIANKQERKRMATVASKTIDGLGATRIGKKIIHSAVDR